MSNRSKPAIAYRSDSGNILVYNMFGEQIEQHTPGDVANERWAELEEDETVSTQLENFDEKGEIDMTQEDEMTVTREEGVTIIEEDFLPEEETEEEQKPKREFSYETCKVDFTPDELREFSEMLAIKIASVQGKEDAKKEVAAQFKADIEALQNEVRALATKVRNKSEWKQVKCWINRDYNHKRVTYIRQDTGEIHRERTMTVDELQTELDVNGQ